MTQISTVGTKAPKHCFGIHSRCVHCHPFTRCTQITKELKYYIKNDYTPCCHTSWAMAYSHECMAVQCSCCVADGQNVELCRFCGFMQVMDPNVVQTTLHIHNHVEDCHVRQFYRDEATCGNGKKCVPCLRQNTRYSTSDIPAAEACAK